MIDRIREFFKPTSEEELERRRTEAFYADPQRKIEAERENERALDSQREEVQNLIDGPKHGIPSGTVYLTHDTDQSGDPENGAYADYLHDLEKQLNPELVREEEYVRGFDIRGTEQTFRTNVPNVFMRVNTDTNEKTGGITVSKILERRPNQPGKAKTS